MDEGRRSRSVELAEGRGGPATSQDRPPGLTLRCEQWPGRGIASSCLMPCCSESEERASRERGGVSSSDEEGRRRRTKEGRIETHQIFHGRLGCSTLRLTSRVATTSTPIKPDNEQEVGEGLSLVREGKEGATAELTLDEQSDPSSARKQAHLKTEEGQREVLEALTELRRRDRIHSSSQFPFSAGRTSDEWRLPTLEEA